MITQQQMTTIKRALCQRLLNEMPDAALGELLAEMREIHHFYRYDAILQQSASLDPEATQETRAFAQVS